MNLLAHAHLTKARDYIGRGERYYERAAKSIRAAREAGASWRECGVALGRSDSWCKQLVTWAEIPANERSNSPYSGYAAKVNLRKTKQRLREGSPEELAAIISSLPEDALDRLADALMPKQPRRQRHKRPVWKGPRRRLHLFQVVHDVVFDLAFARKEIAEMTITDVDQATLRNLFAQIEDELAQARAALGQEKRTAALRAVR